MANLDMLQSTLAAAVPLMDQRLAELREFANALPAHDYAPSCVCNRCESCR